jgi:diguanylate cyclase (GGDEF)-like protein/PAS domain S-box-containing protein
MNMNAAQPQTLLVVDDDENNRDLLARRLRRDGYAVICACGGAEALEAARRSPVDLVLLDNMMPGLSGLEVLQQLRLAQSAADLPVIMVTAQTGSEDVVRALEAGANDYVTKPIDFAVAAARIRAQLQRKSAEHALKQSEQRYALASQATQEGLWDWDLLQDMVFFSARWKEMLGYQDDEIGNRPEEWLDRVHPSDASQVRDTLLAHRRGQTLRYECEHRIRHKDGTYRWVLSRALAVRDQDGAAIRLAGSQTDITGSKMADSLTSLPNRLFLIQRLEWLIHRRQRNTGESFGLIMLDLDGFKLINDSLGHLTGDRLLVEIASGLQNAVRTTAEADIVARLGGDEFAVIVQHMSSAGAAAAVAERIQQRFRAPVMLQGRPLFPTFSMGVVQCAPEHQTPDDLLRDADTAMYHAKARGKGRFEIFEPSMRVRAVARMELETDLRLAAETGNFALVYQPKVWLSNRRMAGFEALLRWPHPRRGLLPPSEFIELAEETGLIVTIGAWALREACRQTAQWQAQFPSDPPLAIGVNLSTRQFAQPDLVDTVREALENSGLAPGSLQLEVTESVLIRDPENTLRALVALRTLSVGVHLDDFGTGYSSLAYLHRFPFDTLKIDRSFIARLGTDRETSEIVQSVIRLAENLGIGVVAEGVETEDQLEALQKLRCKYGQGFLFSRPLPPGAVADLLATQRETELCRA